MSTFHNPVYWTQKNGKKILVDDMDENHVRNALKMLIRSGYRIPTTPKHELSETAQMFNESFDSDIEDDLAFGYQNYLDKS